MKILLLILTISLVSCSRQLHKSKSVETLTAQVTTHIVDTTKQARVITSAETTYYGDTLAGTLYFGSEFTTPQVDSIEAGGIKVNVTLQPVQGGFKARLNAVAKPVSVDKKTYDSSGVKNGLDKHFDSSAARTTKIVNRDAKTTGINWWVWGAAIFVIAVFCWFHFSLKKYV